MEELITVLEHCYHLDETTAVDQTLMCERNLNLCDESHSNLHSLLRDYFTLRLHRCAYSFAILAGPQGRWLHCAKIVRA